MDKRRSSRPHTNRNGRPADKPRARGAGFVGTMSGRSRVYKDRKHMPPPEGVDIEEQLLS
jgi:hypothetical protein